ncbi:hypothetical protein BKA62DRAFT_769063 [Auriculariales sp. MPI-PUGE-AT-0066]|nr:hypothetical protein BKA62DRAFT_769063 [Auriculariales sp. MPI-PUGE-AT-0066]
MSLRMRWPVCSATAYRWVGLIITTHRAGFCPVAGAGEEKRVTCPAIRATLKKRTTGRRVLCPVFEPPTLLVLASPAWVPSLPWEVWRWRWSSGAIVETNSKDSMSLDGSYTCWSAGSARGTLRGELAVDDIVRTIAVSALKRQAWNVGSSRNLDMKMPEVALCALRVIPLAYIYGRIITIRSHQADRQNPSRGPIQRLCSIPEVASRADIEWSHMVDLSGEDIR